MEFVIGFLGDAEKKDDLTLTKLPNRAHPEIL